MVSVFSLTGIVLFVSAEIRSGKLVVAMDACIIMWMVHFLTSPLVVGRTSNTSNSQIHHQPLAPAASNGRRRPPPVTAKRLQSGIEREARDVVQDRQVTGGDLRLQDTLRWWKEHRLCPYLRR